MNWEQSYIKMALEVHFAEGRSFFLSGSLNMGESSKIPKSWTLENQNLKLAVCFQNIKKSKFNGQIPLEKLKLNQKSYYYLQNSAFWGRLSMESRPKNPENFHPCLTLSLLAATFVVCWYPLQTVWTQIGTNRTSIQICIQKVSRWRQNHEKLSSMQWVIFLLAIIFVHWWGGAGQLGRKTYLVQVNSTHINLIPRAKTRPKTTWPNVRFKRRQLGAHFWWKTMVFTPLWFVMVTASDHYNYAKIKGLHQLTFRPNTLISLIN